MRGGRERGEAAPGIDRVSRGSQGEESGTEHDDGFACGDLAHVVRRSRGGRSTTPAYGILVIAGSYKISTAGYSSAYSSPLQPK